MSTPLHPGPLCAEIFNLAQDHGLPCEPNDALLGDRAAAFLEDYRAWVPSRDAEVERYLQATRNRYRTFLPNRLTAPSTAGEMYWYFDDLVLSDPLALAARPIPLLERFELPPKSTLQTTSVTPPRPALWAVVNNHLRSLMTVREAMLAKQVLMTTPSALEWSSPSERTDLLHDTELRTALTQNYVCSSRREVTFGSVFDVDGRPLPEPATWVLHRVDNGFGTHQIVLAAAPKIPAGGSARMLIPFDQEQFDAHPRGVIPPEFEECTRDLILYDLATRAQLVALAQHHRGAVLGELDADLTVMRKLLGDANDMLEADQRGRWSFELALPHLQGLTPMQRFELREELPDEFKAFRAELALYCENSRNVEQAQTKAEALTKLEIELEASLRAKLRSNRIRGYGLGVATAVTAVGALCMDFFAPVFPLIGAGGGMLGMLNAVAQSTQAKREMQGNAACFIWNAKRKARRQSR